MGQANKETPPVINQRHRPSRQLAAVQVVNGEATPAPLVLQFVEGILGIRPIPIELAQAENLVVRVGHQHGIFIAGNLLARLFVRRDNGQQLLAAILSRHHDSASERSAYHDDPAFRFPSGEGQLPIHSLPALAGIRPARLAKEAADVALDVLREFELEQVGLASLFQCRPPLFGRYAPSSLRPAQPRKTSRLRIYRTDVALTPPPA